MSNPKSDPKIGDQSTCQSCGRPITFLGTYWAHDEQAYRHPAVPVLPLKPRRPATVTHRGWL